MFKRIRKLMGTIVTGSRHEKFGGTPGFIKELHEKDIRGFKAVYKHLSNSGKEN
jgi:hypothetical protein